MSTEIKVTMSIKEYESLMGMKDAVDKFFKDGFATYYFRDYPPFYVVVSKEELITEMNKSVMDMKATVAQMQQQRDHAWAISNKLQRRNLIQRILNRPIKTSITQ